VTSRQYLKEISVSAKTKMVKRQRALLNSRCRISKWVSTSTHGKPSAVGRAHQPQVQEADLDQVMMTSVTQNLEASGFMAEMRKRLPR
jgi:hypothetical protein